MKKFLVSINKKFTKECVLYVEVEAADEYYAVHTAFLTHRQYNTPDYWGEAIELKEQK